ncbi:glycosyltransferase [Thermostichus vulcanus]|uniref:Glycosyltransferase n=1 Tax=Thermostichus vulcanus str. 'Rupite' TaxID=2813851 RepID=A0ABT0CBC6_THEVL|nr:glycosyltransferase [Thermostichus vulcanus]MCJ2543027.1 glycosyltransferase [Thermostichus vulcanus str. 'Rupite']
MPNAASASLTAPTALVTPIQIPPLSHPSPIQLSLVIPTYNEASSIQSLISQLCGSLDTVLPGAYELIVVDDNSPDHTAKVAQELQGQLPQLKVICRQQERGLATAVLRGWQVSQGEVLGVIDGDLQHPPEMILKLWQPMQRGADLAVGSRYAESGGVSYWSLGRRIISRGAQLIGLAILPGVLGRVSDPLSGLFLVRRKSIAGIPLNPKGYKLLIEVLARGRVGTIEEVGYVFQERQNGESKIQLRTCIQYLQHLIHLRLSLGPLGSFLRFSTVGLSGTFVDMILLYFLHDPSNLGWGLMASKLISSEVAILNNFLWNDLWTFRSVTKLQPGALNRLKRLVKFNVICLIGLLLNSFLLILLSEYLGIHYLLANLIAIGIVVFWNFYLNFKLSWRVTEVKPNPKNP